MSPFAPLRRLLPALLAVTLAVSAAPPDDTHAVPATKAIHDDVYLQELGSQIASAEPLLAVGIEGTNVFAGTQRGLVHLEAAALVPVPGVAGPIHRIVPAGEHLWAAGPAGLYRLDAGGWRKVSGESVTDVTRHRGAVLAATGNLLWRVVGDRLEPFTTNPAPFVITRVLSHQDSLWVHGNGRLTVCADGRFGALDVYASATDQAWDWGTLPSPETHDALAAGSRILIATDRGLGVLRGMSMTACRGPDGLPVEDTRCLARGFGDDLWIGTGHGAIRWTEGAFHYFTGRRWLPNDRVNAIASAGHVIYLATDAGLGIITYEPYTMLKKAAYYERHLEEWGQKRLGLVHKLEWDDGLKEFVREAGDNDGGYTGDYLAAEAYRWAVTHDPVARREAVNTFQGLRWLEALTGIRGFPARSVWVKGERGHKSAHGSGGYPAEWHDGADARFEWKGDTSSDELCSHFYAVGRFLELAAEGDEIPQAREHLRRMARHVVTHGWQLVDLDGQPTRWGRWDPEYFKTDEGHFDRGLQCLELLSFVRTAQVLGGDASMEEAHGRLKALGYPDQRVRYRRSFERTYEVVRVEQQPWFNFVHAVVSGDASELPPAAAHLCEWPLDLRTWSFHNSHRADLRTPAGYVALKAGVRAFSPREREPMRWDGWTMQADGGSDGRDVVEPSGWLLAYWMGRYHGLIEAPTATDPAVLTVASRPGSGPGAKPYDGPARPPVP